jgi:hypothetical protein
MAIEDKVTIQNVSYPKLKERLLKDHQVLDFESPAQPERVLLTKDKLEGIVVDDDEAKATGFDSLSQSSRLYVMHGYRHDGDTGKGQATATFTPDLPKAGKYQVLVAYPPNGNRSEKVPVVIHHADGDTQVVLNEKQKPSINGVFEPLGVFRFEAGKSGSVTISNQGTTGYVVIDAVQFIPSAEVMKPKIKLPPVKITPDKPSKN